jgi:hypothetical protein
MFLPANLVEQTEAGPAVWLVDQAAGLAHRKALKLGAARQGDLVEVQGITPADKVIATGAASLTEGDRVRIVGEQQASSASAAKAMDNAPASPAHPNQHTP